MPLLCAHHEPSGYVARIGLSVDPDLLELVEAARRVQAMFDPEHAVDLKWRFVLEPRPYVTAVDPPPLLP